MALSVKKNDAGDYDLHAKVDGEDLILYTFSGEAARQAPGKDGSQGGGSDESADEGTG